MIAPIVAALTLFAPQEGRWGPSPITAAQLVQRVDHSLATMSNATLRFQYDYQKATVGRASMLCLGTIVSPKVFLVQVPQMNTHREKDVALTERWLSDGKHFGMATEPIQPKPGPLNRRPGLPAHPANVWFTDFSRVILSGLGQPTKPFTNLLAETQRLGFKSKLELRSLRLGGKRRGWYRLVLTKGMTRYEVVFDAAGYVPVSVLNTIGTDASRWTAVDWNLDPGKSLNRSDPIFRKQGQVIGLLPTPARSSKSRSQ